MPDLSAPVRRAVDAVPPQPWKNGRGVTRELAQGPGWRISLADVAADGAFSLFPHTTRYSVVVAGEGADLQCGAARIALAPGAVAAYDGALPWLATLRHGPVRILNVMVQPALAAAQVAVAAAPVSLRCMREELLLVLPLHAGVACRAGDAPIDLDPGEFLLRPAGAPQELAVTGPPGARALLVRLRPPGPGA